MDDGAVAPRRRRRVSANRNMSGAPARRGFGGTRCRSRHAAPPIIWTRPSWPPPRTAPGTAPSAHPLTDENEFMCQHPSPREWLRRICTNGDCAGAGEPIWGGVRVDRCEDTSSNLGLGPAHRGRCGPRRRRLQHGTGPGPGRHHNSRCARFVRVRLISVRLVRVRLVRVSSGDCGSGGLHDQGLHVP